MNAYPTANNAHSTLLGRSCHFYGFYTWSRICKHCAANKFVHSVNVWALLRIHKFILTEYLRKYTPLSRNLPPIIRYTVLSLCCILRMYGACNPVPLKKLNSAPRDAYFAFLLFPCPISYPAIGHEVTVTSDCMVPYLLFDWSSEGGENNQFQPLYNCTWNSTQVS